MPEPLSGCRKRSNSVDKRGSSSARPHGFLSFRLSTPPWGHGARTTPNIRLAGQLYYPGAEGGEEEEEVAARVSTGREGQTPEPEFVHTGPVRRRARTGNDNIRGSSVKLCPGKRG